MDDVGEDKPLPKSETVVLDPVVDTSPQSMLSVAVNTLMRLAQGSEPTVAYKSAMALMDRAAGPLPLPARVEPPAPQLPAPGDGPPLVPGWYEPAPGYTPDMSQRLRYQATEHAPTPDPVPPPSQPVIAAPSPVPAPAPRLSIVPPTTPKPVFFKNIREEATDDVTERSNPIGRY